MNVGFVRATVVDKNTFRPIYSGRILYSCKEDFPSHDVARQNRSARCPLHPDYHGGYFVWQIQVRGR